jgi:glycosyltransferase involved in cell wall biosynthesis
MSAQQKLRIGIDLTGLWREATGIFVAASNLARALMHLDSQNEYTLFFAGEVHRDFHDLPANARTVIIPIREEFIGKQILMGILCNGLRLDVIHFPAFPPPLSCFRPFIWTLHDATPWLHPDTMDFKGRLYFQCFGGAAARLSRMLVTDSKDAKQQIVHALDIPDDKVKVVHLGVDATFSRLADRDALSMVRERYRLPARFILFVGTREPRKNLPALVRAYRRMRKANETRLTLVIAGRVGWGSEALEEELQDRDQQIVLTGFVPQEDLVALYSLAEIFVLPSLYEGFGFPPLEAMACGCPVIVSNRGSLPEVVGDAALLIDPESEDSIVAAIRALENSPALRADLTIRGMKRVKHFSWKTAAAKTLELYQEVGAN